MFSDFARFFIEINYGTSRCQKFINVIWIGRAGPARPHEQGNLGRTIFFIVYFNKKLRIGLAHRHRPPSSSSWLPKGALAPHLARPIRVPRHSYSSIPPTRVTTKRNDRRIMHMWPVGGCNSDRNARYGKIDRKILVAASFPSWRQSAPRARPGRSCAPNTATKALLFDYASH